MQANSVNGRIKSRGVGLSAAEQREHEQLSILWATQRATMSQMKRCMELDRRANRVTS